jgi:hypothetical protein
VPSPTVTIPLKNIFFPWTESGPRQQAELRPLATTWEELPDGTFAGQGTNVRVALMMVRR